MNTDKNKIFGGGQQEGYEAYQPHPLPLSARGEERQTYEDTKNVTLRGEVLNKEELPYSKRLFNIHRAETHYASSLRHLRATAAFTLVELLIAVVLLTLVIFMLMLPFVQSLGLFRSATARADAQAVARSALDAIARELSEAMYVQLDMYDNTMLAFVPPLRLNPDDPNSEVVTPPRPDWDRAVRYWRALHDPRANYTSVGQIAEPNTFFLARTVVELPFKTDDAWNRWNLAWAEQQSGNVVEGVWNWAPIPRVVNADIDFYSGLRLRTLQPGFPYLAVLNQYGSPLSPAGVRAYRDRVVGMTPNVVDYDVSELSFHPVTVAGEWIRPIEGVTSLDYSVYRARYPLWRMGAPYTGWASLTEQPPIEFPSWARDPFLLIYRYDTAQSRYLLDAVGCFDPRSRTMKVLNPNGDLIYDTGDYPYRDPAAAVAFGVDWIDGSLRFDFPPPGDRAAMEAGEPYQLPAGVFVQNQAPGGVITWDIPLPLWSSRGVPGTPLTAFLIPDSIRVWSRDTSGNVRMFSRVNCTPREHTDQYQVGLRPEVGPPNLTPNYGWLRFPNELKDGTPPNAQTNPIYVDFRWRSNGLVLAGGTLSDEHPALISAYYRSAAVLDISITVIRADPSTAAGRRLSQSAHMTRRVKLRNLLREIRYGES